MNNLLLNAIKYTNAGGSIIIRSSAGVREAEIEVKDTGIGIAPEYLEQIFQPFRRGSKEWLASDGGLGLGLAIARRIVEMHGGGIWAESAGVGQGSTFRLRLPLASPRLSPPDSNDALPAGQVPANSLRILLIDDQKDVAELTSMELQALGHIVFTAADGQSGLETAIREVPDVIISDLKMPRMDGYELIQNLRGVSTLVSVPVIALTGFGMKRDIEAALAAGYDACLNKPVEIDQLSAVIQKLAPQRQMIISKG
jgi:CheY-like chemotaxis protein